MNISGNRVRALSACCVAVALSGMARAQTLMFSEVSQQTGIDMVHMPSPGTLFVVNASGGAVGDFNNDGWQDLFILGGGAGPDRLFINNGDGTFSEQSAAWGVDLSHYGLAAVCADFNGDGWMDISVSSMGPSDGPPAPGRNILYRNNGDGTFTDIAESAGVAWRVASPSSFATAFGDYDNDGLLDLFSTSYSSSHQGNRLYRNNGDETFTDVTVETGLEALIPISVAGFVPSFVDINQDGHLDIILIADTGTSRLLLNNGDGTFRDATASATRLSTANGMGIAIGDINRDGLLDFYVSSIYFSFLPTTGNLLLVQRPDGGFDEVGRAVGVNQAGFGWGVLMVDLDHDGWEEIVATKNAQGTPSHIFRQSGSMQFTDISAACGFLHTAGGRGMLNFDYDNDGDQDIVVFTWGGQIGVWRNDLSGPNTNWLRVTLDTSARPTLAPDGFHSMVRIKAGEFRHIQTIDGGVTHCSSGEHGAHFGLGGIETLDWVRVEWRDGTSTTLAGVAANQALTVRAPFHPGDFNDDGSLDGADLAAFGAAFMGEHPSADLNGDGYFDLADLTTFIRWYLGL